MKDGIKYMRNLLAVLLSESLATLGFYTSRTNISRYQRKNENSYMLVSYLENHFESMLLIQ